MKGVHVHAISFRGLAAGLFAAGAIGVAAVGFAGSAAADQERAGGDSATIKMKMQDGGPVFTGPDAIDRGEKLRVVNRTNPNQIGPHTFTLVKKGRKPYDRIFAAHQIGPPPNFEVGKKSVDTGRKGWDRPFTRNHDGDSWYTERRNTSQTRKVKADVGKTIRYFCAIHPFMKGKFEVTD